MQIRTLISIVIAFAFSQVALAAPRSVLVSYGNDNCMDLMGEGASEEIDYSTDYKCSALELNGEFNKNTDTSYSIGIDQKTGEDSWEELQLLYNNSILYIGSGSSTGDEWRDIKGSRLKLRAEWLVSTNRNLNSKPFAVIFKQLQLSKGQELERYYVVHLNKEQSCLVGKLNSYKTAKSLALSMENHPAIQCRTKAQYL